MTHAMPRRRLLRAATLAALMLPAMRASHAQAPLPAGDAAAPTEVIEKRVFEGGEYRTRAGGTIPALRIGYQTAGRLNAARDNAVLVTHFFSGNSHAFGRYTADGPVGYWDAIIGPGRAIDTDRFFVVSSDTLVNFNLRDGRTVTTGPASLNPSTGRPWGMEFPVVSIRDFVEVQKRLLDSLGVRRLHLVAGASMGALQAIEWAAAYPEMVDRVMPVIGAGEFDPWLIAWLDIWEAPIRLDPNWNNGDYYGQGREPPLRGLAEALRILTLQSQDRGALARFGRRAADGQDPARNIRDRFEVERALDEAALARARQTDANHVLYLARANQLFLHEYPSAEAALARSRARWLVVPAPSDRVFPIEYNRDLLAMLQRLGRPAEMVELQGAFGHLNGVMAGPVGAVGDRIRAFVAN
jgi:homoserine O-acetyltransferase